MVNSTQGPPAFFPGIPDFLNGARERMEAGETLEPHIAAALTYVTRAEGGHSASAREMAIMLEVGSLPIGPCMREAVKWHELAANLGSVTSALRLANYWQDGRREDGDRFEMARQAIRIVLKQKYPSEDSLELAAAAARILLAGDDEDDENENEGLIQQLLSIRDFDLISRDSRELKEKLHLKKCGNGPTLTVARGKIGTDSDFKTGIYGALEAPLPLMKLPDPELIRATLDHEFPWFHNANEVVYRQLATLQFSSTPAFRLRPLLLAGQPGNGKTTWSRRLAELAGVPFRPVMAAGQSDSMYLRGTPRGWGTARPGAVAQTIASESIANPLFLVDELEKASPDSRNGRLWDVLLQLLEPASSRNYLDECLQVPCDFSWVSWIASVNELGPLPKPLLERFTVVLAEQPGDEHFTAIIAGAIREFAGELGIDQRMLPALDRHELNVLKSCRSPREINRTVRMMLENRLAGIRKGMRN